MDVVRHSTRNNSLCEMVNEILSLDDFSNAVLNTNVEMVNLEEAVIENKDILFTSSSMENVKQAK